MKQNFNFFITLYLCTIIFIFLNNVSIAQINTASMASLNIQFNKAHFKKSNIHRLDINAHNVNFSTGKIGLIQINCIGFQQKTLILDALTLILKNVAFNTESLLSKQELVLQNPINSEATITVTENGLNTILNQPKVIEKLANISNVKIKKFGIQLNSGLVSFTEPKAQILSNNTLRIDMLASLADILAFPVTFTTRLAVVNSKLTLIQPNIITSGVVLPAEVSHIINNKLNSIMDLEEKLEDDVDIKVTSLQVIPGKQIQIKANAFIKKLKFSKKKNT